MKISKKKNRKDVETNLSTSQAELSSRILAVVQLFDTRTEAAKTANLSLDQLARYTSGTSQPSFIPVAKMARAKNVSLDWLATGRGPMYQNPEASGQNSDTELLPGVTKALIASVYDLLEHVIEEEGLEPTHEQKARFMADMTAYMGEEHINDTEKQRNLIRLVISNG